MAKAQYDTEQFVKDVITVFKANLNTEITALNTEKADFDIEQINADAWFFETFGQDALSYNQCVVYGFDDVPEVDEPQEDVFNREVALFIEVVMPDSGELTAENFVYQLLRYARALETVARKNFDAYQGRTRTKVTALQPLTFQRGGKTVRAAGIRLTASMTSF